MQQNKLQTVTWRLVAVIMLNSQLALTQLQKEFDLYAFRLKTRGIREQKFCPVLVCTKYAYQSMSTPQRWVGGGMALLILNPGVRRKWEANITSRPIYTLEKNPGTQLIGSRAGSRGSLDGWRREQDRQRTVRIT